MGPITESDATARLASASPLLASAVRRSLGLPLATKVRLVILLVSVITLLTVVTAVFLLQLQLFRGTFARDLEALAAIMAANSSAALDFEDPSAAIESLSALDARPGIISATIVDLKGEVFAHFGREETAKSLAQFSRHKAFGTSGNEWLHTVPIVRDGRSLGFFHLRADYAVCRNELLRASLGIMSGVLACSMILILLLTTRLQKFITRPIAQLAEAARDVARRNDYSVRVSKWADDELGQFTDAFNQMLGEVQRRDADLELQVDALAVSEARFRGVVENLGEALLLVGLDGETLSINPRFTALLGWRQEDLDGQNALKMLMPDAERYGLLIRGGGAEIGRASCRERV